MRALLFVTALAGCSKILGIDGLHGPGGSDASTSDGQPADATPDAVIVGQMIKVTGKITVLTGLSQTAGANMKVELLRTDGTVAAGTTSDPNGMYAVMAATNGMPLDVRLHLKSPNNDPQETFALFPSALTTDTTLDALMTTQQGISTLGQLCNVPASMQVGSIGLVTAMHADHTGAMGLVLSSFPSTKVCYFNGGVPSSSQTQTDSTGQALAFGIPAGTQLVMTASQGTQVLGTEHVAILNQTASYVFPVVVP